MADAPNDYCQEEIARLNIKFSKSHGYLGTKRLVGYLYNNSDNVVMYVSEEYRNHNADRGANLGWHGFTFLPIEPEHSPW